MNQSDLQAEHAAYLLRYGTYAANQALALLRRSEARLNSQIRDLLDDFTEADRQKFLRGSFKAKRLVALRESVRELSAEIAKAARDSINENGKALAEYEAEHTLKSLKVAGVTGLGEGVAAGQVFAAAMSKPMIGVHVRDWVSDLDKNTSRMIFGAIREGLVLGETNSSIVRRIKGSADLKFKDGLLYNRKRGIETVVRTSMSHIASVSQAAALEAAEVEEYYLSVVFDGRTSKICAAWNPGGSLKYYKTKGNNPKPPFHPNCRTIMQARIRDNARITKPFVADDRPVSKIPKSERDGKIGRTTSPTFGSWFKGRDAEFQRNWLGETKYKLYKDGKYTLDRFVDPTGAAYNISELRALDTKTFARIGL